VVITDGEIDEAVAEALTGDGDEQAFVYGFAEFIEQGLEAIRTAGADTDTAKVENFG
jgi:ferredoxin-NADP reductase